LGDFSLPDISWSPTTDSFVSNPLSVHELSLQQVSFIRNSLNRQLDLVFVLDPSEVTVCIIVPLVVPEDRYHPTLELKIFLPYVDTVSPLLSPTKSRCFRKCDLNKLNIMISHCATELFYSVPNSFFCECVSDSFPPRLDRPPWFTNKLQGLRHFKTNFYKKYKKSDKPSRFSRYVLALTNFNVLNSHCYSMYLNRCKFEFSKDPRQFYNFINDKRKFSALPAIFPKFQIYLLNSSNLLIVLFLGLILATLIT